MPTRPAPDLIPVHAGPGYQVYLLKVGRFGFENFSYLILDQQTRQAALVDPAWEKRRVVRWLEATGAQLAAVLLTHSHFDHVNLARPLARLYSPAVWMGRREAEYYGFECPGLELLDHRDTFEVGRTRVQALLTPGHTAGGLCFWLETAIFTGDTLFSEGCGICDCVGGSPEEMYRSLSNLRTMVPPHTRVFPGHSYGKEPGLTLEAVIQGNIYFHFKSMPEFVAFRMRTRPTRGI